MKANVIKTKTMVLGIFTRISKIRDVNVNDVVLNGTVVEIVNALKHKYYHDGSLNWNGQIACWKMCNSLGIMRRIKPFVPQSSLVIIYNTV